jgi:hypothetical protein
VAEDYAQSKSHCGGGFCAVNGTVFWRYFGFAKVLSVYSGL